MGKLYSVCTQSDKARSGWSGRAQFGSAREETHPHSIWINEYICGGEGEGQSLPRPVSQPARQTGFIHKREYWLVSKNVYFPENGSLKELSLLQHPNRLDRLIFICLWKMNGLLGLLNCVDCGVWWSVVRTFNFCLELCGVSGDNETEIKGVFLNLK